MNDANKVKYRCTVTLEKTNKGNFFALLDFLLVDFVFFIVRQPLLDYNA